MRTCAKTDSKFGATSRRTRAVLALLCSLSSVPLFGKFDFVNQNIRQQ